MALSNAHLITLSPETAYVSKDNIAFPGSEADRTAVPLRADARIEDSLPTDSTITGLDAPPAA